jgi:hypothetical protein
VIQLPETLRKTEKIRLGCEEVYSSVNFFPTQQALTSMSIEALQQLYITSINYSSKGYLFRLTFEFCDNTVSPPTYSYSDEPSHTFSIPKSCVISALHFGCDQNNILVNLRIDDSTNTLAVTTIEGGWDSRKINRLTFSEREHIVSADVEYKDEYSPQNVQFIVFREPEPEPEPEPQSDEFP